MAGSDPIINAKIQPRIDPSINAKIKSANAPKADELKRACQDFEAIFVNQMFQQMRRTISKDELFGGGQAEEIFTSMQDAEMAKSISRQRGFGLADVMYRQLSSLLENGDGDGVVKKSDINDVKKAMNDVV